MLSAKIQEMDETEDEPIKEYDRDFMEFCKKNPEDPTCPGSSWNEGMENGKTEEEDIDLDEILAELETETEVEVEDDDTEEEVEDDETESVDIEDMTDEDLKTFIEDVIGDMVASGDLEAGEGFEGEEEVEMDDDEEMDIEIEDDETEEVEIAERISRSNRNLMERLNAEKRANIKAITENKKLRRELREAYAAVNTQKSTLNEVRLLNAKLLYTNKIFKAKSLNENEKVKVLSSFDKATTIKEAKLIFETLSEGLNSKRNPIRESLGSASKLTSNFKGTKNPIIATDPMVARFQKLAGLK